MRRIQANTPSLLLPQSNVQKGGHICRNLLYVISHYSLYHNNLTDIGAIALANALQQNKSLEKLKYVGGRLIDAL